MAATGDKSTSQGGRQRSAAAAPARVRVWWSEGAPPQPHTLREVTAQGMLVVARAAPAVGREVRFELSVPRGSASTETITGTARIVWSAPAVGVGLEFLDTKLTDAQLARLTGQKTTARQLSTRARSRRIAAHPGSVGIDFGTSYLRMAALAQDKPRVLEFRDDSSALAAAVAVDDQEALTVGRGAAQLRVLAPERTLCATKRLLGHAFSRQARDALASHYAYPLAETPSHRWGAQIDSRVVSMDDAARALLSEVKRDSELRLGAVVSGAVIGVPCHFDAAQRAAVGRAARACGFQQARLVTEPIAAAVGYAAGRPASHTLLVVDVGGGHVQAALVQQRDHDIALLAAVGSARAGGIDCDARIAAHALAEFRTRTRYNGPITVQAATRLLLAAEDAKRALSNASSHELALPSFVQHAGKSAALQVTLDAQVCRDACEPLLTEVTASIDEALARSGLLYDELDELVLLGGMTQVPWLRERIVKHVGRAPTKRMHAEQAVVRGLAWLGDPVASASTTVLETLTESLRIAAGTTLFEVLPSGTAWPVKRPLKLAGTGERTLRIHVFSGHGTEPEDCEYLATVSLDTPDASPSTSYLLKLALDEDGLLRASARHEGTGKDVPCKVDDTCSRSSVLREIRGA